MSDDVEIFGRRIERGGGPCVTLARMGRFNFNRAAFSLFKERNVENVLLGWSPKRRLIVFRPIREKDKRAFKMRYAQRGDWAGFSSAAFFKHIGFMGDGSHTLPLNWIEEEKGFVVEVPEEFLCKEREQPSHLVSKRHSKKSKFPMELSSESKPEA